MAEQIYILNENGTFCGLQSRQYVHDNGILHPTVQCWIINKNGDVLIQRRAATKDHSAGKWDVSFGGHCTEVSNANNILVSNVIKEGKEELGLDINPQYIIKLGEVRYTSQKGKNREIIGVFLININDNHQFSFIDGEVSEVMWIEPEILRNHIVNNREEYANRLGALTLLLFYKK